MRKWVAGRVVTTITRRPEYGLETEASQPVKPAQWFKTAPVDPSHLSALQRERAERDGAIKGLENEIKLRKGNKYEIEQEIRLLEDEKVGNSMK